MGEGMPGRDSSGCRSWIAVVFGDLCTTTEPEEAWIVRAESESEAAELAITWFQEHWREKGNSEQVGRVFVAPWDCRVAYKPVSIRAERAELQCCGGPAEWYTGAGGHYATCPERPPGTGQPRTEDEQPEEALA